MGREGRKEDWEGSEGVRKIKCGRGWKRRVSGMP